MKRQGLVGSGLLFWGGWLMSVAVWGQAAASSAGAPGDAGLVAADLAAEGPGASLTFTLDRPGAAAVHYSVQLDEATGQGVYRGFPAGGGLGGAVNSASSAPASAQAGPAGVDAGVPIAVPQALVQKVFAAVPLVRSNRCESHRKGIAQTGTKTLRLVRGDVTGECTYNYGEDDRVNTATTAFEAIAETMQYGDRLRQKLRFDRLGLDAEMDALQTALSEGSAVQVRNIAPVLQAIENDDRVMERVRRRAAHLLESAGVVGS